MFLLGTSWIWISRWVRRWLTLRLYPNKIVYREGTPYLAESLTAANKAVIFAVHLVVLGSAATAVIAGFIALVNVVYR